MPSHDQERDASSGCLLRLFWLILGNLALVVVGAQLLLDPRGLFSILDVLYWLVVAMILAARYADVRYFKGTTAEGKPSTLEDWRRFMYLVVLSAGAAWLAVHVLGAFGIFA